MFSDSEENYLKSIFHLQRLSEDGVSTNAIADRMQTKASSVTDMLKKLADKDLVNYIKYQGVTLTNKGKKTAASIIRKHRLWEVFLVEKLDFNWDEVHEIAEQLEHIESEKLIEKLDKLLDYPKFDPHGDPIPTKDGAFPQRNKILLSELKVGATGICIGVKETSSSFLKFLDKHGIALGKKISILEHEEYDDSRKIMVDEKTFSISHLIASNLYIKPH
ncbi:MAG TPA: metal-dependent transcriptional regulator [Flavobacteriaceae bacterium]|nr:metal-dependent transcriptional regulator [Flavobacteriaceae bacterium]